MIGKVSGRVATALALSLILVAVLAFSAPARAQNYHRLNLQSDIPGVAVRADSNLVNPWGMTFSSGGPIWINDNGTGVAEVFFGSGVPFPQPTPLIVTIPPPAGSAGPSAPTGIVFNANGGFNVTENGNSGSSVFIFDTEDGTISGWAPNVDFLNAVKAVDNSVPPGVDGSAFGAVYKGLDIGQVNSASFIYLTNFRDGVVEIYDSNFSFKKFFTDPHIVKDASNPGFAPFNIANINGQLYVTFAMQNSSRHDDVAGAGSGFVDIFDLNGNFIKQLTTGGALNSPWGVALAPSNFGQFSGALLVGNFGDGRINAFDSTSGASLGQLHDVIGQPMTISKLWAIVFGTGGAGGKTDSLFFTAGIADETHGLFGLIRVAPQHSN